MSDFKLKLGGAITIVNAIALGIGSTIGTKKEHEIKISKGNGFEFILSENADSNLVKSCIRTFKHSYNIEISDIKITTDLKIPPERGLKSSSIVSTAIIDLLGKYYNIEQTLDRIVQLGAKASMDCGVSITGAIDDAYASYSGGFFVTDNLNMKILAKHKLDINKSVLFLIPEDKNVKNNLDLNFNFLDKYVLQQAIIDAKLGNWVSALQKNSKVYGKFLLKDFKILDELEDKMHGIVGLNGAGPSLFVICDDHEVRDNKTLLGEHYSSYKIHETELRF